MEVDGCAGVPAPSPAHAVADLGGCVATAGTGASASAIVSAAKRQRSSDSVKSKTFPVDDATKTQLKAQCKAKHDDRRVKAELLLRTVVKSLDAAGDIDRRMANPLRALLQLQTGEVTFKNINWLASDRPSKNDIVKAARIFLDKLDVEKFKGFSEEDRVSTVHSCIWGIYRKEVLPARKSAAAKTQQKLNNRAKVEIERILQRRAARKIERATESAERWHAKTMDRVIELGNGDCAKGWTLYCEERKKKLAVDTTTTATSSSTV